VTDLFEIILITYIWVMGIKISTAEGMIFEKLGDYGKRKVGEGHKIWEALVNCEWCLPSIHSVFGTAFAMGLGIIPFEINKELFIRWPLVIIGASLISGLTWTIYLTINKIKERNEEEFNYYNYLLNQPEEINDN
jgi:hypothetical protein